MTDAIRHGAIRRGRSLGERARVNVCVYIAGAIRTYVTREGKMSCKLSVYLASKETLIGGA